MNTIQILKQLLKHGGHIRFYSETLIGLRTDNMYPEDATIIVSLVAVNILIMRGDIENTHGMWKETYLKHGNHYYVLTELGREHAKAMHDNYYESLFPEQLATFRLFSDPAKVLRLIQAKNAAKLAIFTHDFGANDPTARDTTSCTFQEKFTELAEIDPAQAYGYALFTTKTYGKK